MADIEYFDYDRWTPSYSSSMTLSSSVLSASFGDGYEQDMEDGINAQVESWDLSWYLSPPEAEELKKWLKWGANVRRFWFTPPGYVDPIKVKVSGQPKHEFTNAGWSTVTATFKQVFDPD